MPLTSPSPSFTDVRSRRVVLAPEGGRGPGAALERRFGMWHWKTWARGGPIGARVRSGWALRLSRATTAVQDALDDYSLFPRSRR
ncbi:MAG: hypothetical protein QOG40_352 [Solirubrobacteraceae bacterium]|jgi:hypothetical protein|nr:hypothetical protein [Solirubrobacteraceae bacterium]